ncbi:MAG: type II toxin-antitoxin system RelE/ParE family toxin [Candidatus Woesebacteria bacterium]|nr:type II toxin-antitoxin system RelE/ParE family toxin [Candidatus Woesebacteria bacterium]
MTKIYYYTSLNGENQIDKFLNSLTEKQQAKIGRDFMHIRVHGLIKPIPDVKKLSGTPLWEIRILGKDSIRLIYAVVFKGHVLILHGFIKRKNKTPYKELKIAMQRFKIWKSTYLDS